jgi:hypothetical protein
MGRFPFGQHGRTVGIGVRAGAFSRCGWRQARCLPVFADALEESEKRQARDDQRHEGSLPLET